MSHMSSKVLLSDILSKKYFRYYLRPHSFLCSGRQLFCVCREQPHRLKASKSLKAPQGVKVSQSVSKHISASKRLSASKRQKAPASVKEPQSVKASQNVKAYQSVKANQSTKASVHQLPCMLVPSVMSLPPRRRCPWCIPKFRHVSHFFAGFAVSWR